jgi:hypothetical protein
LVGHLRRGRDGQRLLLALALEQAVQARSLDRSVDLFDEVPMQPNLVGPADPGPIQLEDAGDEVLERLAGLPAGRIAGLDLREELAQAGPVEPLDLRLVIGAFTGNLPIGRAGRRITPPAARPMLPSQNGVRPPRALTRSPRPRRKGFSRFGSKCETSLAAMS